MTTDGDPGRHLPLKPQDLHILLVLGGGVAHGYGVMRAVEEHTQGRVVLEVGSLYRLLGRLLDDGLIQEAARPRTDTDSRRRYYDITPLGRDVARAETERLRALVASPHARWAMEDTP